MNYSKKFFIKGDVNEVLTSKIVACDTETTGLNYYGENPCRPFAFSFTTYENKNFYVSFPVDPFSRRVMYEKNFEGKMLLAEIFSNKDIIKIFHNINFDVSMIERSICKVEGILYDTKILTHVSDNSKKSYKLKNLASEIGIDNTDELDLKIAVRKERSAGKKLNYKLGKEVEEDYWLCPELCYKYAITDTDRTMALFYIHNVLEISKDIAHDKEAENYINIIQVEHKVQDITREMQDHGIRLDMDRLQKLNSYYSDIIEKENLHRAELGFENLNTNSPKQMKQVFYDEKKYDPVVISKVKDGGRTKGVTTNGTALLKWSNAGDELASSILRSAAAESELSTFIIPFQEMADYNGKHYVLHPQYNTLGATTGRISCNKPNLMNISSNDSAGRKSDVEYRTRESFITEDGFVMYFPDFSQMELWAAAFLANDPIMTDILLTGKDIHSNTAIACWGSAEKLYRKKAKFVNFGSLYGAGADALALQMGSSYQEGKLALNAFWSTYTGLKDYRDNLIANIKVKGYITNSFGRRYFVNSDKAYKSLNYMIQGSCAEVIKRAMINVHNLFLPYRDSLKDKAPRLLLTIHDELGLKIPTELDNKFFMRKIVKEMQADFHTYFNMPIPFGIGMERTTTSWANKKKVTL